MEVQMESQMEFSIMVVQFTMESQQDQDHPQLSTNLQLHDLEPQYVLPVREPVLDTELERLDSLTLHLTSTACTPGLTVRQAATELP